MRVKKEHETIFIGKCNFRGNEKIFGIKTKDRRQHMYIIGKTGVGKTALLQNLALQDIRAGRGIAVIDPHGEFVEEVLAQIPPERTNDVIYFNPVDADYPIGFNVLEVPDQKYKHLVVSDLLGIFTKIWANVWSARMEYILQNCIMALLDTPGTTLLGIPRLLVDKDYRQKIVANVKDPVVKSFWVHEYETWRDQFRNEAIVPIQNKVNQFLNTSFIRNIVGQTKSSLNIPEVMNSGKILLVNVSKGKVGEDNSGLLGAMIITKIQLAAMERVRIAEDDRKDFYLYVDEFQNFATDSFSNILSEARKYRLNIIIAHQYVGQLVTDNSTKVRDAVFGNVGTMISFRVGAPDAEYLETEFSPEFMQMDLINLPNHNVYLKLMVEGITSRPFSAATLPPMQFETDPNVRENIIKISREHYARPRAQVEDQISRWSGMMGEGDEDGGRVGGTLPMGQLIETPCWNCGKTATVPFKPDGKRPVYCMSCLKQIEEGKLIPIPERMPKVGREKFAQSLEGLGIEFAGMGGQSVQAGRPIQPQGSPRMNSDRPRPQQRDMRRPERGQESRQAGGWHDRSRPRPPEDRLPAMPTHAGQTGRPNLRSQPVVRVPQGARPMSLSALKPKEETPGEEMEVPREHARPAPPPPRVSSPSPDLRKVLAEALKNSPQTKTPPTTTEQKTEDKKNKDEKVVNPGDVIQF